MIKKEVFVVLFLFLLVFSVYAEDEETYVTHKSKPQIFMEFDEPINVVDITMTNMDNLEVEYGLSDFDIIYGYERLNATLTPNIPLDNGPYDFVVLVEDLVHNIGTYGKKILVDVPITDIVMLQPKLFVMNASVGDIIIKTREPDTLIDKKAYCKYAHLLGYSLLKKFEVGSEFDVSNSSTHILENYDFSLSYNKNFYVICQDFDGRMNYKFFKLDYDVIPPTIVSTTFNPPKMITLENKFNFTVVTNEDTFCFFDLLGTRRYFGNDTKDSQNSVDSYVKEHTVSLNNILPEENGIYDINLICQDRALWRTEQLVEYEVDLSAALQILVEVPAEYTSKDLFTLDFFTNKPSYCEYSFDDSELLKTDSTPAVPLSHHKSLNEIYAEEGPHVIHFECVSDSAEITQFRELDYNFIVDKTPPSQPVLNGSDVSCVKNTLELTAESFDNESGIDYYMYMVEKGGKQLVNWTQSGSKIVIKDENLNTTDKDIFFITVEAYNKAGLKSMYASKSINFDETGISCDSQPPVVSYNMSTSFGMTFVSLICVDDSGQCIDLRFNMVDFGSCFPSQLYMNPQTVDKNYRLCYSARDAAGNKVNGTFNISFYTKPGADIFCNNDIFDSNESETDVDCGGPCQGCGVGKSCLVDSDCFDQFCLDNVCIAPTCTDNRFQRTIETDLDCGKNCAQQGYRCELGKNCGVHSDCISGFCDNYTCQPSSCDDSVRNGEETDIDCGGSFCLGCGIGSVCSLDSDCASNYCKGGICEDYKKKDCDGDGLFDWWEEKYFKCTPLENGCIDCADPNDDPDGDRLLNIEELKKGTDPTRKDTDGDGYTDKIELDLSYNPLDPKDHPINWVIVFLVFIFLIIASYLASSYTFDYFKPIRDVELIKLRQKELLEKQQKLRQQQQHPQEKVNVETNVNTVSQHKVQTKVEVSKPIVAGPKPNSKLHNLKAKHSVDLSREKERSKLFNVFDGVVPKSSLTSEEFKKVLAKKLKLKKLKKSGISSTKKDVSSSLPAKKQDISELEKFEKQVNVESQKDLSSIINKSSELDEFLQKTSVKKSDKSDFSKLDSIGKNTDSLSRLASRKIKGDALDRILNRKQNRLDELSQKKKNDVSDLDNLISGKRKQNSNLMNTFAEGISQGMNIGIMSTLLKKLLEDGKINKRDLEQLLLELYSSGKLSNVDYIKLKDDLNM
ncbi:hypothetical protein JXM83_06085 [Candidatus Woesearchaeota archaeon]|nr:hypothetical protein [Candidatus Woesearchaeota archaeon]